MPHMLSDFDTASVCALLPLLDAEQPVAAIRETVDSVLAQDHPRTEIVVADGRGPDAEALDLPSDRVRIVPATPGNRAAGFQAAAAATDADYLLLLAGPGGLTLRTSAVRTLVMAARRGGAPPDAPPVALVYSDYERLEPDGRCCEVHLLDYHPGRLRDTFDLGSVWLVDRALLQAAGGFYPEYRFADLYDLRLRLSCQGRLVHVSNRYAGALYRVAAASRAHNVFDYLLAGKEAQLEAERACTVHLKRIGAYLAPGAHVRPVEYAPDELERLGDCLASVVTPVNHRPEFIGRAIESVQNQTVSQVEMIVVVNGGPDDPTCAAVRRYLPGGDRFDPARPPVRLLITDVNNLGLCLNMGIAAARGKYYVQLDSDDRLKPDAIEKLLAVFDSDPTVGMVIGSYEVWTLDEATGRLDRNDEIPVVTHDEWTADNGRNNLLRINGAGAPRAAHIKVIREVGWFGVNDSPHCRNYGEDYDLVLRISERYTIGRVYEPIYEVIRHSGGTDHAIDQATINRNDNAKDQMRAEALARRMALNRQ